MAGTGEAFVLLATVFGAPGPPFSVQDRRSLPRDHRSLRRDQRICAKIVDPCRGTTGPSRETSVFRPKSLILAAGSLVPAAGSLVLGAGTLVLAAGTLVPAAGAPFFGEDRSSLRRSPGANDARHRLLAAMLAKEDAWTASAASPQLADLIPELRPGVTRARPRPAGSTTGKRATRSAASRRSSGRSSAIESFNIRSEHRAKRGRKPKVKTVAAA